MSKASVIAKLVEAGHEDLAEQLVSATTPTGEEHIAEKDAAKVVQKLVWEINHSIDKAVVTSLKKLYSKAPAHKKQALQLALDLIRKGDLTSKIDHNLHLLLHAIIERTERADWNPI